MGRGNLAELAQYPPDEDVVGDGDEPFLIGEGKGRINVNIVDRGIGVASLPKRGFFAAGTLGFKTGCLPRLPPAFG